LFSSLLSARLQNNFHLVILNSAVSLSRVPETVKEQLLQIGFRIGINETIGKFETWTRQPNKFGRGSRKTRSRQP
jgi:hypothetical protein